MRGFNYQQICSQILEILPERQKEVLLRRFALKPLSFIKNGIKGETLESIGKDFKITRERIRQIEKDGFLRLKSESKKHQKVFNYFKGFLEKTGNLRKEDDILSELGGGNYKPQIYFLLNLKEEFKRYGETDNFYALWTIDEKSLKTAQKIVNSVYEKFKEIGKPLDLKELTGLNSLNPKILTYYLEISKRIQGNQEGLFGLRDWPEINPKRIRDKAYFVFKKEQRPLHFVQAANLIDSALPQTVHNELIKDSRFVLVGRGTYALREWGYEEGMVKDVIFQILKTAGKPLAKEEILEKTLRQRLVKENTVLLNLSNKEYFFKTPEGYYKIREA